MKVFAGRKDRRRFGVALALGLVLGAGAVRAQVPDEEVVVHLPLVLRGLSREALPPAVTVAPSRTPTTPPSSPTPTPTPSATATPTTPPTPTTPAETGTIHGRMTAGGEPLAIGFGSPGSPQIELRRQVGGQGAWELVANAEIVDEQGGYAFENPPALGEGEVYQVWWRNPAGLGADLWMGRWWSRDITAFGQGEAIDLGTFELADLQMTAPCHDCSQTPPIDFEWEARANASERYRWAIFQHCDQGDDERATAWLSPDLGRQTSYTSGPPSGFQLGRRYCWYVRVEDGENGGGWPFYARRVTWLASAGLASAGIAFD